MGCRKAQICAEFCKIVQKTLLCNTPFSYTPFCVSPISVSLGEGVSGPEATRPSSPGLRNKRSRKKSAKSPTIPFVRLFLGQQCWLCRPFSSHFWDFWSPAFFFSQIAKSLGSRPPSTEPETPKPRKVSKKSAERSLGPPDPEPPKSSEKSRKSPKNSQNQLFFGLFRPFSELFGGSGRGVPNFSRETFLRTFRWFRGFGLCRWSERSQRNGNRSDFKSQ